MISRIISKRNNSEDGYSGGKGFHAAQDHGEIFKMEQGCGDINIFYEYGETRMGASQEIYILYLFQL